MEIAIFWFVMAVAVTLVASSKGYSRFLWFFYGLLIWPIALVHILTLPKSAERIEEEKIKEGRIKCPSCSEWILGTAKSCPHCSSKLSSEKIAAARGGLEPAKGWEKERILEDAAYKIYLADTYRIEKHDLFDKYVCKDKMFDQLQEALNYAHEIDLEVASNPSLSKQEIGNMGPNKAFTYTLYRDGLCEVVHASGVSLIFESRDAAFLFFNHTKTEMNAVSEMKKWPQKESRERRTVVTRLDFSELKSTDQIKSAPFSYYDLYEMKNTDMYLQLDYGHRKVSSLDEAKEHLGIQAI